MILVIVAMMEEAREIASKLKKNNDSNFDTYEGVINNKKTTLIVSGIGKVNAGMATTYGIAMYKPDMLVNIGIVGGYKTIKNNTYLVAYASYHDFDLTIFNYEMGQVPKYPTKFHTNELLLSKFDSIEKLPLYTGDSFSTKIINNFPYLADMEGTAIYQIAHKFNLNLLSLKIVSDLIGNEDQLDNYKEVEGSLDHELCEQFFKLMEVL